MLQYQGKPRMKCPVYEFQTRETQYMATSQAFNILIPEQAHELQVIDDLTYCTVLAIGVLRFELVTQMIY